MKLSLGFAKDRNQSAQSKIFSQLGARNGEINTSANARVNELLNNKLSNKAGLLARRANRVEEIKALNREYIQQTQGVLNDKALAFLVQHSNIDAPTFTSIMAGFELAKASRADKLNEERQLEIDTLEREDAVDQQVTDANNDRADALVQSIQSQRALDNRLNEAQTQATSRAVGADISQERNATVTEFRENAANSRTNANNASRERVARINADSRTTGGNQTSSQFLSDLRAIRNNPPNNVTDATEQDVEQTPGLVDRVIDFATDVVSNSATAQVAGAVIDEVQSGIENAEPQQQIDTDEVFTNLVTAAAQDLSNQDGIDELNSFAENNDLSPEQRELVNTLSTRTGLQSALDENPDDAQVLDTISFLDSEVERQQFELSPERQQQLLEEAAQSQADDQARNAQGEISRLQQGLEQVNNILANPNFTDEQKQGSVVSKQDIEARLTELGAL